MHITIYGLVLCFVSVAAAPMQKHIQRSDTSVGCISKYYNKDLGPLEILMMPLGEKLWLRAWLGMHMSNLLHMEGVDLAEVSQTETDRAKRSTSDVSDTENESKVRKSISEYLVPHSYELWFRPKLSENVFYGVLELRIICLHPTVSIILHASSDLKVDKLKLIRIIPERNKGTVHKLESQRHEKVEISRTIWNEKQSVFEIILQESLIKDALYRIDIEYHGYMNKVNDTLIFHHYLVNSSQPISWFMATNLKHGNAMKIFPCFPDSKYKATFEINIIHPEGTAAITSSPLHGINRRSDLPGWIQTTFKVTPPMAPSSLAFFILDSFHFDTSPVTTHGGTMVQGYTQEYSISQAETTIEYVVSAINFFERRLGVTFPAPQLNIIFLRNMTHTAEDYWGLVLARSDVSPPALLFYLLKQWFGHYVTAENINEEYVTTSLAYYYAYFCSLDLDDECEAENKLMTPSHTDFIALLDMKEKMHPQEFMEHKMVLFLRMLNFSLSEKSFQRGIQVFLKYRSYSTFVQEDLWDALDIQAWSDGTLDRKISTKDISVEWLSQDLMPLVTISAEQENMTLTIEQQVFIRHWPYAVRGQNDTLWQIPIGFITEDDMKEGRSGMLYWLKEKKAEVQEYNQPLGDYFIGNYNNIGMYIVNYDDSNWRILSEKLLSDGINNHFVIPGKTRASLIRNAWCLAMSGNLNFTLALNMTLFLKYETDPLVWKSFAEVYFMVAWKLIGTGLEIKFDQFIGDLLLPIYENTKLDGNNNAKEMHALAYYVLCKAGYEPAIGKARLDFDQWLETHQETNHGAVGGVLRWIDEDWERGLRHVLDLLQERQLPQVRSFLLSQLAGNPNQDKIERLLSIVLTDPTHVFSKVEIKNVLPVVSSCRIFLEFLSSEWNIMKERFESEPNMWQYILEQTAKKCKTADGVQRVEEFYKTHQYDLGTSGNSLKHSIEVTRRNLEVVYYQIDELEEVINQFLA